MSTRCHIGIENADGTITFVYLHHDGYPEKPGAGAKLLNHYATEARVRELLAPGDMSVLDERCDKPSGHSYEKPADGYCIYYGRDRGEENTAPTTEPREAAIKKMDEPYAYVFSEGCWHYRDHGGPGGPWQPLTQEACA